MFPHPSCTKETRTVNQKRLQQQQPMNYAQSPQFMGYSNTFPSFENYPSPQQFQQQQPQRPMQPDEYLRPNSSSVHIPLSFQHDHYMVDRHANDLRNQQHQGNMIDRIQQNTRNIGKMKHNEPVQMGFQHDYFMTNFETLNDIQNINRDPEMLRFMDRNPTDVNRDQMEKTRLKDKKEFLNYQGGNLQNFVDLTPQYTRKERHNVNTNTYTPMARTLAIPKEKI